MIVLKADLLIADARSSPIPHGAVAVDDSGRIAYVGPATALPSGWEHAPHKDLSGHLLMPGMVNGHAHSFQSLFRGMGDDLDFDRWVSDVLYPASEQLGPEDLETGAFHAFGEMLLSGITSVLEFFYITDQANQTSERVIGAARQLGIRLVFGRALYDANPRAPLRYREGAEDAADRVRSLAHAYRDDPLVTVVPAPHSPHAATSRAIRLGAQLAEELDTVWTMHLAERRSEVEQVKREHSATSVRFLRDLGVLTRRAVLVHGVWLGPDEWPELARTGAALVHNPSANLILGDGTADLVGWRTSGLRTALGTDGGCTNNRLSILDEMRTASLLAKGRALDGAALGAPEAFSLGTEGGADVLGLQVGRMAPGLWADLVALDLDDPSLMPNLNPVSQVVYAALPRAVRHVFVAGRAVVEDGVLLGVSRQELRERMDCVNRRLARKGNLPL